jgi:hypothetical protein
MIEWTDTSPDCNVDPAEYARLLGFPRGRQLEGRAQELADWARQWYTANGRPWIYARQAQTLELIDSSVVVDGVTFASSRLQQTLKQASAHTAIVVAVSAGHELENEAQRAWREEKPDEYFFLEVYGSAVVERLITVAGARLCAWGDEKCLAVLPHYSPGYPEWAITDQPALMQLVARRPLPAALEAMDTGMLRPKKSQLGVFGLTSHTDRVRRLTELVPCASCSFNPCQYRRAPYRIGRQNAELADADTTGAPLNPRAKYTTNPKALARWVRERLSLTTDDDGTVHALFRYDGTTCTNMGTPLRYQYSVTLGPRADGYPIREQRCAPEPGDTGHRAQCRYISSAAELSADVEKDKPLLGKRLNEVLTWGRPTSPAGCYCEATSRLHKWGLVLETIHFALAQEPQKQETQQSRATEEIHAP